MGENADKVQLLAEKYQQSQDDYDFELLIKAMRSTINHHCNSFKIKALEYEDLMQIAQIAIWEGCKTYDKSKGRAKLYLNLNIRMKLITAIKSSQQRKSEILNKSLSLDYQYRDDDEEDHPIISVLNCIIPQKEPLEVMAETDSYLRQIELIKEPLSPLERLIIDNLQLGVNYMEDTAKKINQDHGLTLNRKSIDNAIQRIRKKTYCVRPSDNLAEFAKCNGKPN